MLIARVAASIGAPRPYPEASDGRRATLDTGLLSGSGSTANISEKNAPGSPGNNGSMSAHSGWSNGPGSSSLSPANSSAKSPPHRKASPASTSTTSASTGKSHIGERRGSLNPLFVTLQTGIIKPFTSKNFVQRFNCDVLNASRTHWVPSTVSINLGHLEIHERRSGDLYAVLVLQQAQVIGHLGTNLVQIVQTRTQLPVRTSTDFALIQCSSTDYGTICAALFAWSQLRMPGVAAKLWYPPPTLVVEQQTNFLSTNVKAFFTPYNTHILTPWASLGAILKHTGELQLIDCADECVYSIHVKKVLSSRIKPVHVSLVESSRVLLLFPDMGGPETVYIKFGDRYEFAEWLATLRAFSKQPVAAPVSRSPLASVRFFRSLTVKIGGCEADYEEAGKELSRDAYVEISFDRWRSARTCVHSVPHKIANWNEVFEFPGPDETVNALSHLELKLKRGGPDGPGELDPALGSATIPLKELISSGDTRVRGGTWKMYNVTDTFRVNVLVDIEYTPVLDASYYSSLNDWMGDLNLKLAQRLIMANTASLGGLFPVFDRIYRAQGRQLEWIFDLIDTEVPKLASSNSEDTLFRGSSLLARSVESLLQQQGAEVLQRTVTRFIRKLVAVTTDPLELDPARCSESEQIEKNYVSMSHFLRFLWSLIYNEGLPPLCRPVFVHFRRALEDAGLTPEAQQRILCRTLSAFLFLRFYVPALMNPQHFNLTNRVLTPEHRRSLVLVAKIIQGFANRVKFGNKEQWLVPMNTFIETHDAELVRWYVEICRDQPKNSSVTALGTTGTTGSTGTSSTRGSESKAQNEEEKERELQQLPVNAFMGQQLMSPNLVDEPAAYSLLANYIVNSYEPSLSATSHEVINKDPLLKEVIQKSQDIVAKQRVMLQSLQEADTIDDAKAPMLHMNSDTQLFGTNPDELTPEAVKQAQAAMPLDGQGMADSLSQLNWILHSKYTNEVGSELERPKASSVSSVKKLTQMLRLSR